MLTFLRVTELRQAQSARGVRDGGVGVLWGLRLDLKCSECAVQAEWGKEGIPFVL